MAKYELTAEVVPIQNIEAIYKAVESDHASKFSIIRPTDILLPKGADSYPPYHQQGIQKTTRGEFVVSGSAENPGYVYFTNANYEIAKVVCPKYGDYNHCGGIQVVDDILVVGYEHLESGKSGTSKVLFYDISNIKSPKELSHLNITRDQANSTAGAVALSQCNGIWLLIVANWNAQRLDFYTSNTGNLYSSEACFAKKGSWSKDINSLGPGSIDQDWASYQNINLFTQADGKLYFIGMHTKHTFGMPDWADLYLLDYNDERKVVTKKGKMHFKRCGSGPRFDYGSGYFYDEPVNRFIVYDCEASLSEGNTKSRCNKWE